MSIAQSLLNVAQFFKQICPLCGRENRITVLGVYRDGERNEKHPDIGYSFCNCKNIFYTRFENLNTDLAKNMADPAERMRSQFIVMKSGEYAKLILPDPFFCEWDIDPYKFLHWNPRQHWIIWDKDQFEEEMGNIGFEIVACEREFDLHTEYMQTFSILLRKP